MIAQVRYRLAALGHSQRYLPPVLLLVALLGMLYSDNAGPPLPGFTVTAGALLVVAGWLTIAMVDVEDPVQRMITRSHSGSMRRLVAGLVLAVLMCCVALTILAVAWAALSGPGYGLGDLGLGVVVHLVCASVGIALGLLCSPLLVQNMGYALIIAIVVFTMVLLAPWIPLVHPLLYAMNHGWPSAGMLLWSVSVAICVLVASTLVVTAFSARRA